MTTENITERLREIAAQRAGGVSSEPNFDPELLMVMTEAAEEIERLRALLKEAALDLHSWGQYADEYYKRKWDLDGNVLKYLDAASGVAGSDKKP